MSKSESSESLYNDALEKYPILEKELRLVKIYADNVANLEDNLIPEYSLGFKEIVDASEIEEYTSTKQSRTAQRLILNNFLGG